VQPIFGEPSDVSLGLSWTWLDWQVDKFDKFYCNPYSDTNLL